MRPIDSMLEQAADPIPAAVPPALHAERTSGGRPVLDELASLRLELQQRSGKMLRRHLERAVRRVVVLVVADLASFGFMRASVRAVRDAGILGSGIASAVNELLPKGILSGWQYAVALVLGLLVTGNYGEGDFRRSPGRLFYATSLATALPLWMTIWTSGVQVVFMQFTLVTFLVWAGLLLDRFTIDRIVGWVRPLDRQEAATLLVGSAEECRAVRDSPAFAKQGEFRVVGFVDTADRAAHEALGHVRHFGRHLAESHAETVVFCGAVKNENFLEVVDLSLAAGCRLLSVPTAIEAAWVQPSVSWRGNQPVLELVRPSLKGWQVLVKRAMDIVGGAVGLLVLSPMLLVIAAAIRWDSPGPVLFRQERVGLGGRRFLINKFRTMRVDAEGEKESLRKHSLYADSRLFKMVDDPRVTRVGRVMRRLSFDEWPQLWNVLCGEMSLVGPRPPVPAEVALYAVHHYARFDVKPGMTGPWQVSGRNVLTDFEQIIRLETAYIREWSLAKDLGILLQTIPAVLGMRGAH